MPNKKLHSEFFQQSNNLFGVFDKNLKFITVNKAFEETWKTECKEFIRKHLRLISPEVNESQIKKYLKVLSEGKPYCHDTILRLPGGGNVCTRLNAFKVNDDLGIVFTPIGDLQEKIDDLDSVMYKVSHDIRGPITGTLGLLNLLQVEESEKIREDYIEIIRLQTERLDKVFQSFVYTARTGKNHIAVIDFHSMLEEILTSLSFLKDFKKIKFKKRIDVAGKFYSYPDLIYSVLQNLIENAIKYKGKSNSWIAIDIKGDEHKMEIFVSDNGIGINEEKQHKIFKKFFRATDQASGTGIGLYSVANYIKKLGGTISFKSKAGKGTSFDIQLPNMKNVE